MQDIHLIEKSARYNRKPNTDDQWTTGNWSMNESTAKRLIGGTAYLHTAQQAPCYLGGEILNCKEADDEPGRYVIHFRFDKRVVNTTTRDCKKNWSVEMLIEPTAA